MLHKKYRRSKDEKIFETLVKISEVGAYSDDYWSGAIEFMTNREASEFLLNTALFGNSEQREMALNGIKTSLWNGCPEEERNYFTAVGRELLASSSVGSASVGIRILDFILDDGMKSEYANAAMNLLMADDAEAQRIALEMICASGTQKQKALATLILPILSVPTQKSVISKLNPSDEADAKVVADLLDSFNVNIAGAAAATVVREGAFIGSKSYAMIGGAAA
ncbi:MAG: hypothetical protein QXR73_03295, partial [Candidatus Micrarchaeaceae archaeon]